MTSLDDWLKRRAPRKALSRMSRVHESPRIESVRVTELAGNTCLAAMAGEYAY